MSEHVTNLNSIASVTFSVTHSQDISRAATHLEAIEQQLAALQAENAKLRACVELYADKKNWAVTGVLAQVMNLWVGQSLDGDEPAQKCLEELKGGDV